LEKELRNVVHRVVDFKP